MNEIPREQIEGYNPQEFVRGMDDCKHGHAHKEGQSKDYDAGYDAEYWLEQMMAVTRDE